MQHPIEKALLPFLPRVLRQEEQDAREWADRIYTRLAEHNWRLNDYAPLVAMPDWTPGDTASRIAREKAKTHNHLSEERRYVAMTVCCLSEHPADRGKQIVVADDDKVDRLVETRKRIAEDAYLAFIAKMIKKAGEGVVHATVNHRADDVWDGTVLNVEYADGVLIRWKTNRIINISKNGTRFHQWPTRKLGGGKL